MRAGRLWSALIGDATAPGKRVRPNPSLEPGTSTGMALGPRDVVVHHPSRGPSTIPVPAPQLKR